ncbi:MAG: hypothetical protein PHW74_07195 [Desulfobacca sp.]|nr:hypothetical protein [Desulfobacca sp.]
MSYTGKHLVKVALKLGYEIKEGGKHILVYNPVTGKRLTLFSGGNIKKTGIDALRIHNSQTALIVATIKGPGFWTAALTPNSC